MHNKNLSSNWTTGWYGSLSVKITSIVLWGVAIIGAFIAIALAWDSENNIRLQFNHNADTIALTVSQNLFQSFSPTDYSHWNTLTHEATSLGFTGMQIKFKHDKSYQNGDTRSKAKISRKIYYYSDGQPQVANLYLYHIPFKKLQRNEQKRLLLTTIAICLIFGLSVNWIIQKILNSPFQSLLEATKKISEGRMDVRLDTKRQDEFGQLAQFFNKMMDQISAQQNSLKDAIEQAEIATRAKSTFIANMSHELRTPLNSIIGFTTIVKDGLAGDINKEQVKQLTKAHSSAKHLLSLINELLDLSIIESGKVSLKIAEFKVAELLIEVTDMLKPLCEKKSLRLHVEYNNCGLLLSDQGKVRQILIILIDNAIKFTQQGSINVKSWGEKDKVWFEITDTGSGIDTENIEMIFMPFYQEDSAGDREHEGTGMGLALCKQYLNMLGGDIEVTSQPEQGSRFSFYINRKNSHE